MSLHHNKRLRFIVGLTVIMVLFSLYNLYLLDESWFMEGLSRPERHVLKFASVLVVYSMGVLAFAGGSPGWLLPLWNFVYAILVLLLVLLGLFDTYVQSFSMAIRNLAVSVHVFLISPVPFVFVAIIGKAAARMTNQR